MPDPNDFMDTLSEPAATTPTGLTVGLSSQARLELAMRRANESDPSSGVPDPKQFQAVGGVPNPYGRGVAAFEPNNVLFQSYRAAKGEYDQKKAAEDAAAKAAAGITVGGGAGPGGDAATPLIEGTGKVATMIRNAMSLAARRVPYVWGGTTANGVDCSGLLYYAFSSAGLDVKRWRAVDYGRMGVGVTLDQARPGDIVYYDEPGGTDHVGLYIGNGQMIQAPQSGDVVKVSKVGNPTSIRRIFDDQAFGSIATPGGGSQVSYGGSAWSASAGTYQPGRGGLGINFSSTLNTPRVNPAPGVHGPLK